MTSLASLAWRVAAVASGAGFLIDSAVGRRLPGRLARFSATPHIGSTGLMVVFLLVIIRNLILATPYVTLDPASLQDFKQQNGIYDEREPKEVRAAREGVLLLGTLSFLLVVGWMAGDPPLRRTRGPKTGGPDLPSDTLIAVRLSGMLEINHIVRRTRDEQAFLEITQDPSGKKTLVFYAHRAGRRRPLGLQTRHAEISKLEAGEAYGLFVPRPSVRFRAPPGQIVISFDDRRERDAALRTLRSEDPTANARQGAPEMASVP
jgi:hypothetical protein